MAYSGAVIEEDIDPAETREWLEALEAVMREDGPGRARELLEALQASANAAGASDGAALTTPYVNTIAPEDEPEPPGDEELERRFRSLIRWNAIAIILQANKRADVGGHIASYQSAATLYEVGFNHFWKAPTDEGRGDLVYIQGHSSPGIYARAYLEGRLTEEHLRRFRQELAGGGLPSYPHPWLMPDFWQFPTVSMGLGAPMSISQARFMKYLQGRGIVDTSGRTVWTFMGDGEMDEPESLGMISMAGRERLDNLVFVVNCNLQRLDGPVRGNGKIIQELETVFRGAGWNVIKLIWGSRWDPLLAADHDGLLRRRMGEAVDGEYQVYKARDGAYVREHFFGAYPELAKMVEHLSDEEIWALNRGGHDARKIYAAYAAAEAHAGQPTVILAKTIKGYGLGEAVEGRNVSHQAKKMAEDALFTFRERFQIDLSDEEVRSSSFHKPPDDAPEMVHLHELRQRLGGFLPQRRTDVEALEVPGLEAFQAQLDGTEGREVSNTMAFVRILATLLRDRALKDRVVPIVADESRTFGMEGMFRQLGIFSQTGQLYEPEDAEQLMFYKEDKRGQILQEGISEAGAISSWIAGGTSYANHGVAMLPVYVFYSMFGFQRVGDLIWAAGDSRARGFLIGGTSGRTTLNGEGLQHEDGHSHLMASAVPNCIAYDPAYAYEVAVIVQDGLRRMVGEEEDVFFYITVTNENYAHPAMPEGAQEGILRGLYALREAAEPEVQLLGAGAILNEVVAAADLLREDFGVQASVWSVTSFSELARDGMAVERRNRLAPTEEPQTSWVEDHLGGHDAPVVAASDYVRALAEQIRPYVPGRLAVLGTDGFGRSDSREGLRGFFEVDPRNVARAALHALGREEDAAQAIERYEIDADAQAPWRR
ncbi:MAG TPA: pyruvate dehydrogenase (acetyl-transferring), homodimeric type [Solirubrobacteraceae bacterium]|nr:pyruvate dehydrogenase (acetyl-transferring), homodimeric type [Solirubrobacteraceae bacterium]